MVPVESLQVRFADDGDRSGPVEGTARPAIRTFTDAGILVHGAMRGLQETFISSFSGERGV